MKLETVKKLLTKSMWWAKKHLAKKKKKDLNACMRKKE